MEYQDVLDNISKLKKPYKYYLYLLWRGFITAMCCVAFLVTVGALIYLGIEKGWFDGFKESPGVYFFIYFVPIVVVIGGIVSGIIAIWNWGVANKLNKWSCNNGYSGGVLGYRRKIKELIDEYYKDWEEQVKADNEEFNWLNGCRRTFVDLPYHRNYPTNESNIKKVEIPLFYKNNYYSKNDYKQIISELNIEDGEQLIHDIIYPPINASQYYADLLSKFQNCSITRFSDTRSVIDTKDGNNIVVLLAQFTSLKDVEDICDSAFLEKLIPYKKVMIVAVHKEYSKDELVLECNHRRKVAVFSERFDSLQCELEKWKQLLGYPYYYFYNYYPSNMTNITSEDKRIRELIYNFKNSSPENRNRVKRYEKFLNRSTSAFTVNFKKDMCKYEEAYERIVEMVYKKIYDTIGCDAANQVSFVCIPAHSEVTNRNRLEDFYRKVCERTGLDNAYQYISSIADERPKHMGGKGLIEIVLDETYFKGKEVVIFDDIVTHGTTMSIMVNALNKCGAKVLFIITLAKTCNYISQHPIHADSKRYLI